MSPFHFARVFRELAGTPPHQYLLRVRLTEAARRLRDGDRVTNACFASGFSHLSHFGRLFHRRFGVLPSQYPKSGGRWQHAGGNAQEAVAPPLSLPLLERQGGR
jgi:AraC-like DNA-binding protein